MLDQNLKVVTANNAFFNTLDLSPDETTGVLTDELGGRQWDIPGLRKLLEDILPQNTSFHDFEVEHDFESIGRKIMHLDARQIHGGDSQTRLILLAIEDVTEREHYRRHLEEMVAQRTAELSAAKQAAEKNRQAAEDALVEIKKLKDRLEAERAYLQEEIKLVYNHENIVGQSDAINYVCYKVRELENVEREYIIRVLEQMQWKVSGKNSAAEILGLDRSTLCARMRKLNIRKP